MAIALFTVDIYYLLSAGCGLTATVFQIILLELSHQITLETKCAIVEFESFSSGWLNVHKYLQKKKTEISVLKVAF